MTHNPPGSAILIAHSANPMVMLIASASPATLEKIRADLREEIVRHRADGDVAANRVTVLKGRNDFNPSSLEHAYRQLGTAIKGLEQATKLLRSANGIAAGESETNESEAVAAPSFRPVPPVVKSAANKRRKANGVRPVRVSRMDRRKAATQAIIDAKKAADKAEVDAERARKVAAKALVDAVPDAEKALVDAETKLVTAREAVEFAELDVETSATKQQLKKAKNGLKAANKNVESTFAKHELAKAELAQAKANLEASIVLAKAILEESFAEEAIVLEIEAEEAAAA